MIKDVSSDIKKALVRIKDNKSEKKFSISDLKIVYPYLIKNWKKAASASFFMVLLSLSSLPIPYITKYIIDDVIVKKNIRLLALIALILIVIVIVRVIFSFLVSYFFTILNQEIFVSLRRDLFVKILTMPLSLMFQNQSGYLVSRLGEAEGVRFFFSDSIVRIMISSFELVFCLCILFYLNWKLTLFSLSVLPLFFIVTKYFSKGLRKINKDNLEKSAQVFKNMQEIISGIEIVKNFNAENREGDRIYHKLKEFYDSIKISIIISSISTELILMISTIFGIFVLWISGVQITKGTFTIGGYIAFVGYLAKVVGPIQSFSSIGLLLQPAIAALNRISEIINIKSEKDDNFRKIQVDSFKGHLEFKNVSFYYPGENEILSDVSFEILPGQKVAIIGETGAGKSSIVKLFLGYFKPIKGDILIDKININEILLSSLRKQIGIISQNIFLFNDSIRNNILYSKPDAKEIDLVRAAKYADAHEFIVKMKDGYETLVGEDGKRLSGGQKQKIAIARTVLRDCDIVIFDEATSQIDSKSEMIIRRAMDEIFKEKTCIIIAHRTSILDVDKVFYLEKGKIKYLERMKQKAELENSFNY